jgi:hypothetical protein
MIQLLQTKSAVPLNNLFYLPIYDKMTNTDYTPLFGFTSQLSKKTLYACATFATYTDKDRYVKLQMFTVGSGTPDPEDGIVTMGTTDYPYGLYDTTIYQNTSDDNLDPDGLTQIWAGLMNLEPEDNPAVEYEEYDTNDSDTESVYITF